METAQSQRDKNKFFSLSLLFFGHFCKENHFHPTEEGEGGIDPSAGFFLSPRQTLQQQQKN